MNKHHRNRMVGLAALVVIIAGLRWASAIVVPFMVALLVTILVAPLIRSTSLPKAVRLPIAFVFPLLIVGTVGWMLLDAFGDVLDSASAYGAALERRRAETVMWLVRLRLRPVALWVHQLDAGVVAETTGKLALETLVGALTTAVSAAGLSLFMAAESVVLPGKLRAVASVPLTVVMRMLLAQSEDWRWLAVLVGSLNEAERERGRPSLVSLNAPEV